MPSLFGIDIAAELNAAISSAGGVLDATLTKHTPGTRTPGDLAGGTNPTGATYACKGFLELGTRTAGASGDFGPSLTRESSATVTLLGASIASGAIPVAGDHVTIEGATWAISSVSRDPAGAAYVCTVRGA
jgi:hypothetical protein